VKQFVCIVLPALLFGCGGGASQEATSHPLGLSLPLAVGARLMQATNTSLSIEWEFRDGAVDYRVTRDGQPLIVAEETQNRFRDIYLTPGKMSLLPTSCGRVR
jgi:hypothetical protein